MNYRTCSLSHCTTCSINVLYHVYILSVLCVRLLFTLSLGLEKAWICRHGSWLWLTLTSKVGEQSLCHVGRPYPGERERDRERERECYTNEVFACSSVRVRAILKTVLPILGKHAQLTMKLDWFPWKWGTVNVFPHSAHKLSHVHLEQTLFVISHSITHWK